MCGAGGGTWSPLWSVAVAPLASVARTSKTYVPGAVGVPETRRRVERGTRRQQDRLDRAALGVGGSAAKAIGVDAAGRGVDVQYGLSPPFRGRASPDRRSRASAFTQRERLDGLHVVESRTTTMKLKSPTVVGVPLNAPQGLSDEPAGNC